MNKHRMNGLGLLVAAGCAVIGSAIGTHVGPGAYAVAFFAKND